MIVHRNDNAAVIPGRELKKLVYGADSVFARSPTASQVAAMSAADITDFLHAWERPDGAVFGMAGLATSVQTIVCFRHTHSLPTVLKPLHVSGCVHSIA